MGCFLMGAMGSMTGVSLACGCIYVEYAEYSYERVARLDFVFHEYHLYIAAILVVLRRMTTDIGCPTSMMANRSLWSSSMFLKISCC